MQKTMGEVGSWQPHVAHPGADNPPRQPGAHRYVAIAHPTVQAGMLPQKEFVAFPLAFFPGKVFPGEDKALFQELQSTFLLQISGLSPNSSILIEVI